MDETDWETCADPGPMLVSLARAHPLDVMTARRFAAACVRRIWPLLTDEHAREAVVAWETEASAVGGTTGSALPLDPDAWTAEGEAGQAALTAARAVWAGDARAAAVTAVEAVRICLGRFVEEAVRQALEEVASPGTFPRTRKRWRDEDDYLDDTWDPAWREAWSHSPALLTPVDLEELKDGLRDPEGVSFRTMVEEYLEGSRTTSYERLEAEMLEISRRKADEISSRECSAQAKLLRTLIPSPFSVESARSDRKMRLWAVARARLVWHLLTDERSRRAVEVAERYADGLGTTVELAKVADGAWEVFNETLAKYEANPTDDTLRAFQLAALAHFSAEESSEDALDRARGPLNPAAWSWTVGELDAERLEVCARRAGIVEPAWLDAEIFGESLRHPFDPGWGTATVLALARSVYKDHAFGVLPILADALEDAECDNTDILAHCRGPGPHARGCWVLDLILRKR
jgi:hypothetical protein